MKNNPFTSRQLALGALILWSCSIPFPGIVLYYFPDDRLIYGFFIIALGWLSPLMLNFAWFANIFFLCGVILLLMGKRALKSSIIALLLSLDTLRLNEFYLNIFIGSTAPVYGFGWGAILWFLSLSLLLAAAGTRQIEIEDSASSNWKKSLRPIGFVIFVSALVITLFFAVYDRIMANNTEKLRLEGAAFKKHKICSRPDPEVSEPISNFSGILEIVTYNEPQRAIYPLLQIDDLLRLGIPSIRFRGRDYSIDMTTDEKLLVSVLSSGESSAVLYVGESNSGAINARLEDRISNRLVFDHTWEMEVLENNAIYCPDYDSSDDIKKQPVRLLMQALNLLEAKPIPRIYQPSLEIITGTLISSSKIDLRYYYKTNRCPPKMGYDNSSGIRSFIHADPFLISEKWFYLDWDNGCKKAICNGNSLYLYHGDIIDDGIHKGKYSLKIQKRTIPDFHKKWSGNIQFDAATTENRGGNRLKIRSVKEEKDNVVIEVVNETLETVFLVQAPLHD